MAQDWELWFAYMDVPDEEFVASGGLLYQLEIPERELRLIRLACALSRLPAKCPREFVEMAIWERLEAEEWHQRSIPRYSAALSQSGVMPCVFCGDPTELIDTELEEPFCHSALCLWLLDEEYRMSSVKA